MAELFSWLPNGDPSLDSSPAPREVNTVAAKPSRDKTILSNRQRNGRALTAVAAAAECAHEDLFAHIMYASACAFVLSDDETHRRVDYFPVFSGQRHSTEQYRGEGRLYSRPTTGFLLVIGEGSSRLFFMNIACEINESSIVIAQPKKIR